MSINVNIVSYEVAIGLCEKDLIGVCKRSCSSILISVESVESWIVLSWLTDDDLKMLLYDLAEKRYISLGWMANMRVCPACGDKSMKRVDILPKMKALTAEVF
jgi:hypothetical protein